MPVPRQRRRDGEPGGVQGGHEGVFFQRGEARHVHPGGGGAVPEVVAVGFDGAEGYPAQAVDFEDALLGGSVSCCLRVRVRGGGR